MNRDVLLSPDHLHVGWYAPGPREAAGADHLSKDLSVTDAEVAESYLFGPGLN